ncbi:unnamed protein product [Ixodes persulcatus]
MNIYDPAYVTNFTGLVNAHAAVSWSPHNRISVITNEAVRILSSPCSPSESGYPLHLEKMCIDNPVEPLDLTTIKHENMISYLDTDQRHCLMLDTTMCPGTSNSDLHRTYHRALWSPLHLEGRNRCLLATLTLDHRLQLWRENAFGQWLCVAEPSAAYFAMAKARWKSQDWASVRGTMRTGMTMALEQFELLRQRSHAVAALEMSWSHLFEPPHERPFALLVEATRSGLLLFWKVQRVDRRGSFDLKLLREEQTNLTRAARLCWQKTSADSGFLVLGSNDGTINLLPLKLGGSDELVVGAWLNLWEDDLIPAQHALCKACSNNTYLVCVAKGRFLLCFRVAQDDQAEPSLSLKGSNFTKEACESHITAFDQCPSTEWELHLLACTMSGHIMEVKVNKELEFTNEKLNIELPWMLQPVGLNISPNGIFMAIFYHIATPYNYNVIREPLQLTIYNLAPVELACQQLLSRAAQQGSEGGLCSLVDCLDRVHSFASSTSALPQPLEDFVRESREHLSKLSSFGLKLFSFLTRINVSLSKGEESDVSRTNEEVLWRHVSAVIENCNAESLDARQVRSLRHFANWMALTNRTPNKRLGILLEAAGHPQAETTTATPPPLPSSKTKAEDERSESGVESCPICDCGVLMENLDSWECLNHHKWGRCMHSLLVCDESPNRRCVPCGLLSHRTPVWTDDDPLCLFCDTMLV